MPRLACALFTCAVTGAVAGCDQSGPPDAGDDAAGPADAAGVDAGAPDREDTDVERAEASSPDHRDADAGGLAGDAAGGSDAAAADAAPDAASCARWILTDWVTNARELGDHELAAGGRVACRVASRGGHLGALDSAGCEALAALSLRTVVDLRTASVQQSSPPAACVAMQAALVSAPMPQPTAGPSVQYYLGLLDETAAMASAFTALCDPTAHPVYVHCVIGRDRASVVAALLLMALGGSRDMVVQEFMLNEEAGIDVDPAWIEAVLDEVELRGGIDAYLGSVGISADQLAALRASAIDP